MGAGGTGIVIGLGVLGLLVGAGAGVGAAARSMSERDRDESGRPRNTRPRDALGRLLPPGSKGVPRIPDDLELSPIQTLAYAQDLLDRGLAFNAHEVLEAAWKNSPDDERIAVARPDPARGRHHPRPARQPQRCDQAASARVGPSSQGRPSGAVLRRRRRSGRLGRCAGRRTRRGAPRSPPKRLRPRLVLVRPQWPVTGNSHEGGGNWSCSALVVRSGHLGHTQVCDRQLEVALVEHLCSLLPGCP